MSEGYTNPEDGLTYKYRQHKFDGKTKTIIYSNDDIFAGHKEYTELCAVLTKTQQLMDQNLIKRLAKDDWTLSRSQKAYAKKLVANTTRK